ncbi:MAG: PepSY domain-containing protein [Rhizobiaceae bacterium]|nr:PepSY domain-containing protein [Rhizobiaceae bacterium]
MKTILSAIALFAAIPVGAAMADSDDCNVSSSNWQSREAVTRMASEKGWTVHELKVDDGCYELEGRDRGGRRIEVAIHPATLQVMDVEYEDDDDRGNARNAAPAGTVAPPKNGLFGNGAPPKVQQN